MPFRVASGKSGSAVPELWVVALVDAVRVAAQAGGAR